MCFPVFLPTRPNPHVEGFPEARYQVTFSSEESAWTRKRNADFLALQLKVQQAAGGGGG